MDIANTVAVSWSTSVKLSLLAREGRLPLLPIKSLALPNLWYPTVKSKIAEARQTYSALAVASGSVRSIIVSIEKLSVSYSNMLCSQPAKK